MIPLAHYLNILKAIVEKKSTLFALKFSNFYGSLKIYHGGPPSEIYPITPRPYLCSNNRLLVN